MIHNLYLLLSVFHVVFVCNSNAGVIHVCWLWFISAYIKLCCRWLNCYQMYNSWTNIYTYMADHYNDVIMGAIASPVTSLTIVYSIVYSDADQRKHQSSVSLAFVGGNSYVNIYKFQEWSEETSQKTQLKDQLSCKNINLKVDHHSWGKWLAGITH